MSDSKELDAALSNAVTETIVHADKEQTVIQYAQDVGPILEANKRQRDAASSLPLGRYKERTKGGMNFHQAARIPMTVILDIKSKYGLNLFRCTPDEKKRIWSIIQTDYPYCLTMPGRPLG